MDTDSVIGHRASRTPQPCVRPASWRLLMLSFVCALAFWPSQAAACQCGEFDPQESFNRAGVVFSGTTGPKISPFGDQAEGIRIEVERVYKGDAPTTVYLAYGEYDPDTGIYTEGGCDYLPPPNQRGVFFAFRRGKFLETDFCLNSIDLSEEPDFQLFGEGEKPDPSLPTFAAPPETTKEPVATRTIPAYLHPEAYPGGIPRDPAPWVNNIPLWLEPFFASQFCAIGYIAALVIVVVIGYRKVTGTGPGAGTRKRMS